VQPPVSFDRVAGEYDGSRALPPELQAFSVEALGREVGSTRLLDVGAGTGRFAVPLQSAGHRVVGCDVSSKMLARAWSAGWRDGLLADARRLPFRDASFRRSTSNHLLHLVRDWPGVLLEIARVTDGRYLSLLEVGTETPDLSREYHRLAARSGPAPEHPGLHERDLPDRLAPDDRVQSETLRREVSAESVIERLDRRLYSSQWTVSEADHRVAMAELRRVFAGARVATETRVDLAGWETDRIREFARRSALG
jgi:SAM-dependent methyltransferase